MAENNCSVCSYEKVDKKVLKGISDSNELKYYLCVKCWLCKQEVAILVPIGLEYLFYLVFFFVITSIL